jgi:hypothetical protein
VNEFRSLTFSFVSLFRSIVGEMDYEALQQSSRVFGPLYFIVFQVMVLLILVNVFLAIMNDAYSFVKEEDAKTPDQGSKGLGMISFFKSIMAKGAKGAKVCMYVYVCVCVCMCVYVCVCVCVAKGAKGAKVCMCVYGVP